VEDQSVRKLSGGSATITEPDPVQAGGARASKQKLVLAFAAVYLIWGSAYLGIKVAIETLPPFLMAGARFMIAGAALYLWSRRRGGEPPTRAQWRSATIVGALLFLGGNGAVTWAEKRVNSGLASLLMASVPLWMVLMAHAQSKAQHKETRLGRSVILGLTLGGDGGADRVGAAVLLCGAASWALGSLYCAKAELPRSTPLATSMQMLCGGALLLLLGLAAPEVATFDLRAVSMRSMLGFSYLIVSNSVVGFTCYNWLLRHATLARVSTYAYVSPVVAVFLGGTIGDESVHLRTLAAAALVLAAVALIITYQTGPMTPRPEVVLPDEDIV
jgi:drug/metabolite transporter (DMT)-like permease